MAKNVELYQLTPNQNVLMNSYVIRTKNDKIIVIDDMIGSGRSLENMFEYLTSELGADIIAVIAIIDTQALRDERKMGSAYIQQKYKTKVYTLITDEDIRAAQARFIL